MFDFEEAKRAAVAWQYNRVRAGGIARKSECDAHLCRVFGIDAGTARTVSNSVTGDAPAFLCGPHKVTWVADWFFEQYICNEHPLLDGDRVFYWATSPRQAAVMFSEDRPTVPQVFVFSDNIGGPDSAELFDLLPRFTT